MKKANVTKPILPKKKVKPSSKRRKVKTVPNDDTVCVPKPPANGDWKLVSSGGVIPQPYTWQLN